MTTKLCGCGSLASHKFCRPLCLECWVDKHLSAYELSDVRDVHAFLGEMIRVNEEERDRLPKFPDRIFKTDGEGNSAMYVRQE